MNNEIKEILDFKEDADYKRLSVDEITILREYITNLQKEKDKEIEELKKQLQQRENIIKDIKAQLDYLETYSSKEDVFEDMKRRLDRIDKIIGIDKDD